MATLADTKSYYRHFDWRCSGEHWATRWRGTDVQWYGTVLPRIRAFIPTCTIVEIGCGQGRLSQRLTQYCEQLILVDMTERCVRRCEQVFRDQPRVRTLLCNGSDLAGVEDSSADFVFSLFSLVHADAETMRRYLAEIARVLNPRGTAFMHHSNGMACLTGDAQQDKRLNDYRDASVDAAAVRQWAEDSGLACRGQELFGWDMEDLLTDCFSVLCKPTSWRAKRCRVVCNWTFPDEARRLGQLTEIYGAHGHAR